MLIVEHIDLVYKHVFISTQKVKLDLFKHESGNLILSSNLTHPEGVTYYVTSESLLNLFFNDEITLQDLFYLSPSIFIEIMNGNETRLFLRHDVDIMLESGEKKYSQIQAG